MFSTMVDFKESKAIILAKSTHIPINESFSDIIRANKQRVAFGLKPIRSETRLLELACN